MNKFMSSNTAAFIGWVGVSGAVVYFVVLGVQIAQLVQ